MTRLTSRLLLGAVLTALPAAAFGQAGSVVHGCASGAEVSAWGGWQLPGATPPSGDSSCTSDDGFLLYANYDSYVQSLRLTPDIGDLTVEFEVMLGTRDGNSGDAFSLLLHWNGTTDPSACCEPVRAGAGLRVLFSLDRNRLEVYQEIGGDESGPLTTLPVALAAGPIYRIKVGYRGTVLDLTVNDVPIGLVNVPATPAGPFGFDAHGVPVQFSPFTLRIACPGDADCDGIGDGTDNCPTTPGTDQTDTDHDGLGNLCDADDDGDGINDAMDVCPLVANPQQEDADFDGIGDACDVCPADPQNDPDGDRVCGLVDNCPGEPNPDQQDFDGDLQGDACDIDDGYLLIRWSSQTGMTWQHDFPYNSFNLYRRNIADLRATGTYVIDPNSSPGPLDQRICGIGSDLDGGDPVAPGEGVAYFVSGSRDGLEDSIGNDSEGAVRTNAYPCDCTKNFTRVLHGWNGPAAPQNALVTSLAEWCALLPSYCSQNTVNYSTHVALVVARGFVPDSCHDIQITCLHSGTTPTEVGVVYEVSDTITAPGCGCFMIIGYPFDVVKIPRPIDSATFGESYRLKHCP